MICFKWSDYKFVVTVCKKVGERRVYSGLKEGGGQDLID